MPIGGTAETKDVTADANVSADDAFVFDAKLTNGIAYAVTTTSPIGKTCTVTPAGTRTMGDADANIEVTCVAIPTYSIGGTVNGAVFNIDIHVVLTLYDDNSGAGGTKQTVISNAAGTFSFTGVPENKFYTLQASSIAFGEICSIAPTTPTQVTMNITDARVTCSNSTGPFLRIEIISDAYESSLSIVNVFVGNNTIPDTSGTPTQVIRGADTDVVIVPRIFGFAADGFLYNIPINTGQYYAVTVTTTSASETCTLPQNATGGPVTSTIRVQVFCN